MTANLVAPHESEPAAGIVNVAGKRGLTASQAIERLKKNGPNELPSSKPRKLWEIALEVFREPMFLLLLAAGVIYFIIGDLQDALLLLGFVFVVMAITLYQERKTERALDALRDLSSPRALVIREGERTRIAGRDVVPGDILVLSEGDRIPADASLLDSVNLSVDESMLTGESVPVLKEAPAAPFPDQRESSVLYSGTMVVQGQGIAEVRATGRQTELGKIGKSLQTLSAKDTPLQRQVRRVVKLLAFIGGSLCVIVVILYGAFRGSWSDGLLAGIALAMAILPEELPVVLTIFLALGAWRMSKSGILTRRIPAVETLGSATVLCVDKTGTLTQNRMSIRKLSANGFVLDLAAPMESRFPEEFHRLIEFSILASQRNPFDPMEVAFREFGESYLTGTEHLHGTWRLIREYPLSRDMLAITRVWKTDDPGPLVVATKGAPEAISKLCKQSDIDRAGLLRNVEELASQGLRVIAVGAATHPENNLPETQSGFDLDFIGLVGLADPVRESIPGAIRDCYAAGIRVVMITGDYPVTAQSIAGQIGLVPNDKIITGRQLESMSDDELMVQSRTTNVFARVVPEQKLRIVNALKANGEVVAMTGDGVNDAPALKAAHIGVAMGARGTDVARESASLVLLNDDFTSIVQAVRMGRRIFDNLKKAMTYVIAVHIPLAGMSVIPIFFDWPLVLMPVHIAFLQLVIDPACSTAFEAEKEEANVMRRPARNKDEPIFDLRTTLIAIVQGILALAIVLIMFIWALSEGKPEQYARGLAFTTLIVANLALIWTNRSWAQSLIQTLRDRNLPLWVVTSGALTLLGVVLNVPFLNGLLRVSRLDLRDFLMCGLAGMVSVAWFEVLKYILNSARKRSIRMA